MTCDRGAEAGCGATQYFESDGRVTGLLGRGARLFQTRASEAAPRLVTWLTSNPAAFGLRGDITAEDLDLALFDSSAHGPLSIVKLRQRYRGLPVLGPEALRQLFDNVAAYYSCEHGIAAFESVRAVLCTHRIMDCGATPPLLCGECGDGVVDVGEQCDRTAIPTTCEALGYEGGELACSLTCELQEDGCWHPGPTSGAVPTTGGSSEPVGEGTEGTSEPGPDTSPASASTSVGDPDTGGCGCRERGGSSDGGALSLGLLGLVWSSRRRRKR